MASHSPVQIPNAEYDLQIDPLGNNIAFNRALQRFCKVQVPAIYDLLNNFSYFFL